jgi:hypothetical protein
MELIADSQDAKQQWRYFLKRNQGIIVEVPLTSLPGGGGGGVEPQRMLEGQQFKKLGRKKQNY